MFCIFFRIFRQVQSLSLPGLYLCIMLTLCMQQSLHAQKYNSDYQRFNYAMIDSIMYIHLDQSNYSKGIRLTNNMLPSSTEGDRFLADSICGKILAWRSFFYQHKADYDSATFWLQKAHNYINQSLGSQHPYGIQLQINLAGIYTNNGQYRQAQQIYEDAIVRLGKLSGRNNLDYSFALNNLGLLYHKMGMLKKAFLKLNEALGLKKTLLGVNHPDVASNLNNLAQLNKDMANYSLALNEQILAVDIWKKALGELHPDYATALNNLALLHSKLGHHDLALKQYEKAKDIRLSVLGPKHILVGHSFNNLAICYQKRNNLTKALDLFRQAKAIFEQNNLGIEQPEYRNTVQNIAELYCKMQQYEAALPLLDQFINGKKSQLVFDRIHKIKALKNKALIYYEKEAFKLSRALVFQALNIRGLQSHIPLFNQEWLKDVLSYPFYSNEYVNQYLSVLMVANRLLDKDVNIKDKRSKQLCVVQAAIGLLEKQQGQILDSDDKYRFFEDINYWLLKGLDLLNPQEDIAKAFAMSDRNKSILLRQVLQSDENYRLGILPDSLIWKEKELALRKNRLKAHLMENKWSGGSQKMRQKNTQIHQQIQNYEFFIKEHFPQYYQAKYDQTNTNIKEIQSLLDPKSALIEYVVGDSAIHIFWIDKKLVSWKKLNISRELLVSKIHKLHQALSNYSKLFENPINAYQEYAYNAYWFYSNLVEPILKSERSIHNLIIITDDKLGHLPFEVFLREQAPQILTPYHKLPYLLLDYNISYSNSAAIWKNNKEAIVPQNNSKIMAVAGNFDTLFNINSMPHNYRSTSEIERRKQLVSLPGARKEVKILEQKYKGFFVYDQYASEKTVKENAVDYAILHIASHGIFNQEHPLLSSLVFSEDNDSIESNYWQAYEISQLPLKANLVVLSACESGYGKVEKGNGIASLARAFMYAGVPSIVATLWQINDDATINLMDYFYKNLSKGMVKSKALKEAKIQYFKQANGIAQHPAFWSPFILMGNDDALTIQEHNEWPLMAYAAVIFLLMLGFYFAKKYVNNSL